MRYLSVCSGIEAASVAWKPLGWECVGLSEIDKFPRAVLQHRLGAVPVDDDHRWQPGQNFTPLFGDFTKIEAHHVGPVDLLVGGTPCQSFSIAGKRLGLDDPRGNLTLEFLALALRVRARFIVWENVPGILSHDGGRTFGTFLGFVEQCGFRWAYRTIDAQYCRTRRFPRAVPQRRRRVFLVGYSGTADINPAAVLFDRESLRGNPAPRREAGQGIATDVAPSLVSSGRGVERTGETRGQDPVVAVTAFGGGNRIGPIEKAATLVAKGHKCDFEVETFDAYSLRPEGFDASEDGTGRGTPIVPVAHPIVIQERAVSENPDAGPDGKGWRDDGAAYRLEARQVSQAVAFAQNTRDEVRLFGGDGQTVGALSAEPGMKQTSYVAQPVDSAFTFNTTQLTIPQNGQDLGPDKPCHSLAAKDHPPALTFTAKDHGGDAVEDISPTLRAGGHSESHANAGVPPAIAFAHQAGGKQTNLGFTDDGNCQTLGAHQTPAVAFKIGAGAQAGSIGLEEEVSPTLTSTDSGTQRAPGLLNAWCVRRLTPRECERLMGFPDDYTLIPWRGKPDSECPDGPRYKALGNSFAVNVVTWIGERIEAVRAVEGEGAKE